MSERNHHSTTMFDDVNWSPARPVQFQGFFGWFQQKAREFKCAKEVGHCWHLIRSNLDWFCCECGRVDSVPPNDEVCVYCQR